MRNFFSLGYAFHFSLENLGENKKENIGKIKNHWQLAPVLLCYLSDLGGFKSNK